MKLIKHNRSNVIGKYILLCIIYKNKIRGIRKVKVSLSVKMITLCSSRICWRFDSWYTYPCNNQYNIHKLLLILYHFCWPNLLLGLRLLCSKFYLLFFPEFPKNFAHYSFDHYSHKILELNDCSIRVYQSFWQNTANIAPPSATTDTCTKSLLSSWTVFETSCPKWPKILKLCLQVSYNSGIILSKIFTNYS